MAPSPAVRAFSLVGAALAALAIGVACDDGGSNGESTATPEASATQAASPAGTAASNESLDLPFETGEKPIFWRTYDQFESVQAEQAYKVVLRVTNGYAEESLPLVAQRSSGGATVEFEAQRAEPVGADEPGSYYVLSLAFPQPGSWELTATAGADEATVTVDVAPGGGAAG